jgi:hypothetical protein
MVFTHFPRDIARRPFNQLTTRQRHQRIDIAQGWQEPPQFS